MNRTLSKAVDFSPKSAGSDLNQLPIYSMPSLASINLHPDTHPPSSLESKQYDVICIGSGWAGRVAASRCVAAGLTAIVIEKELIGGDCPFWACVPSKALLRPPEALDDARHATGARERLSSADASVDVEAVFQRRDMFTGGWDDTKLLVPMVESSGVHIVRGIGRLTGVKTVTVTLKRPENKMESVNLEARQAVVICTGSAPYIPDVPGLREAKPWDPRQASSSSVAPETLFILGGGVVGAEMATIYQRLGSKVILASRGAELLTGIDPEAGALVRQKLTSRGAQVLLNSTITKVERKAGGVMHIEVTSGSEVKTVVASELLVASGRRAVTDELGLNTVGIEDAVLRSQKHLRVNNSLVVTGATENQDHPWLYAAGDVNGRAMLTHTSKYHGRIVASAIITHSKMSSGRTESGVSRSQALADGYAVPQVIFTDPQIASVGLTGAAAQRAAIAVKCVTAPVATLGAQLHAEGYEPGWAQWVVEKDTGVLLGATFVGSGVAELLHASTVAIVGKMTVDQLTHAIPPFPTMSEVYLNLMEAVEA